LGDWPMTQYFPVLENGDRHSLYTASGKPESLHSSVPSEAEGTSSKAMLSPTGGIDLNQINVNRNGKTVTVQFDQAQLSALEQGGFEGFAPVITGFQYIKGPFPLLGINTVNQPERLAKV